MDKRVQKINDDTVLEITEQKPVKTRLSMKSLMRRRDYLTEAITRFQTELADTDAKIQMIQDADTQ